MPVLPNDSVADQVQEISEGFILGAYLAEAQLFDGVDDTL